MDNKGYYKTLGVAENATEEEIRKSYKKLALQWHPDRWVNGTDEERKNAEDNFKKINEAYSVLSDKEKRSAYDMGVDGNFQQGPGFNPFDIFKQHFRNSGFDFNFDFNDGFQQGPQRQAVNKGQDVNINLDLTMEEANNGVNKTINYETHEKCEFCNGTGFGAGGGMETCPHCNGTGMFRQVQRMGFATVVNQGTCPYCNGSGKTIKNPCTHCGGTGLNNDKLKKESVSVKIPVGIAPGETVIVQGFGDYPVRGEGIRGNLNIDVNIKLPDNYNFTNNIGGVECELDVPFYDAILGCEKEVKFPSGKMNKVKIDKNTKPGTVYSFKGEGMKLKDGRARASFDVLVNYTVPKELSKKQEEKLKEFKNITENGS